MTTTFSQVRVPGKVMLSGEYAVLSGERSVAVTVDRLMTVHFEWHAPGGNHSEPTRLKSNLWEVPRLLCHNDPEPFAAAVRYGIEKSGLTPYLVSVESDLDVRYGLGSSSALRLAVSLGFRARTHDQETARKLAEKDAYALQFAHQSQASGYDVLTQSRGGLVVYKPALPWPGQIETFDVPAFWRTRMRVLGGGQGAPTGPVMQDTLTWLRDKGLEDSLLAASCRLTDDLMQSLVDTQAWPDVYRSCGAHRRLFQEAPHEPRDILAACEALPGIDRTWSIKTTGAGGEDALLVFGTAIEVKPVLQMLSGHGWEVLPLKFANMGAEITGVSLASPSSIMEETCF